MRLRWLLPLACLLAGPVARAAPDTSGVSYDARLGAALPAQARFVDQDGRAVDLGAALAGRPAVIALGYFACPSLCGLVRDDMFSALARSGLTAPADYQLFFVSIDPSETAKDAHQAFVDDLARYPDAAAGRGWHFLTGSKASIDALTRSVGFRSRYSLALKQFIHPAGVVIATPDARVSGYLLGVGYTPGDMRAAVVRANAGGVEKAVQPVLLLCFHFDPNTGRYTFAIVKVLRLAGVVTVIAIVSLLVLLRRRERRA